MTPQSQDESVKQIQELIRFAIEVAIFFSAFFYAFMRAGGTAELQANQLTLIWGGGVAFYVINYFLLSWFQNYLSLRLLSWFRGFLIVGILAFVPLILITVVVQNRVISELWSWLLVFSMQIAFAAPFASFLLLVFGSEWGFVKTFFRKWKRIR